MSNCQYSNRNNSNQCRRVRICKSYPNQCRQHRQNPPPQPQCYSYDHDHVHQTHSTIISSRPNRQNSQSPRPPVRTTSVISRIFEFDTNRLQGVFPFNLISSIRQLIDATWRCFQLRYQLFPIRFPGGECDPEGEGILNRHDCEQRQHHFNYTHQQYEHQHPIPSSVDFHGLYEVNSQPPTMFKQNNPKCKRGVSPGCGQRSSLTRTNCSSMNCSCRCCSCSHCCAHHNPPRRRPFIAGIRPCPQHVSLLESLEEPCCQPNRICTRANASGGVNLNIRLVTSSLSDCSIPEAPRKTLRRKSPLQSTKSTNVRPTSVTEATCITPKASEVSATTSSLIGQGVNLLQEGVYLMECNAELAKSTATTAYLQETAHKLNEAMEGQLSLLREENEVLRVTNSILRNQLLGKKLMEEKANEDKLGTAESEIGRVVTENPKVTVLHSTADTTTETLPERKSAATVTSQPATTSTSSPDTAVAAVSPTYSFEPLVESSAEKISETNSEKVSVAKSGKLSKKFLVAQDEEKERLPAEIKSRLESMEQRIAYLECQVGNLEKSKECHEQHIANLLEKLHRQEIRYHETITKFDETCQSMKCMFDGLKAAVSAATTANTANHTHTPPKKQSN